MDIRQNLRQEVTAGARAFSSDTSPTCPHLSADPYIRGKQIRAVAIDRIVDQALIADEVPSFYLKNTDKPDELLAMEATDILVERFREVLGDYECGLASMYSDSLGSGEDNDDEWRIPSTAEFETITHLGSFIKTGVEFSTSLIDLAVLAYPDTEATFLYGKLAPSYPSYIKKFTGGKSIFDLDFANSGVTLHAPDLAEYVTCSDERLMTKPGIIKAAKGAISAFERLIYIARKDMDDRSALCPGSIEVHDDGRPVMTERVWTWTVEVAQKSELIERLRELEVA